MSVVSRETRADLRTVTEFFGIDESESVHLFRHAADKNGDAFASVFKALAEAIREDVRSGATLRIRRAIREKKQ